MVAQSVFGYNAGMEWVEIYNAMAMKTDIPCNVTAAREAFNKNGGGNPQPSFCCYDIADPLCYQKGLEYNQNVWPALHSQAVWDAWKPFIIAAPTVVAFQLACLAGYKIGRYMKKRAKDKQLIVADA